MDLRTSSPYWLLRHGIINSYPSLNEDIKTDILVIGAGISGALVAWELTNADFNVTVLDARHAGMGSTAASTGLLQYELDIPLRELIPKIGEKNAVTAYKLCLEAIAKMDEVCRKLKMPGDFQPKPNFQFASFKSHTANLYEEFLLRKKYGLRVDWMEQKEIENTFGFSRAAGIMSADGAESDAYQICHALLQNATGKGLRVFDKTTVAAIRPGKKQTVCITQEGQQISAKQVVIACGYESQTWLPKKILKLWSTFAIASEPFTTNDHWYRNAMIWETARPYLYLRSTYDHRIIIGGKDIPFTSPEIRNRMLTAKTRSLEKSFGNLFPATKFKTDFAWSGTFASTKDGLPYIGEISKMPGTFFIIGAGGNGITFSVIAAGMIKEKLKGRISKNEFLFRFNR